MRQETRTPQAVSSLVFQNLEAHIRGMVQQWCQDLLEAEVNEVIERGRYIRREPESPKVYRNGHGKPRKLTFAGGTVTVRRPRLRGLEEKFESLLLPLFARTTPAVRELLPELYLHGLAGGDFDLALRGLLGEDAPLSASTLARLKEKWQDDYDTWKCRDLSGLEPVYLWADGLYVKAGLEKDKAALLVIIAGLADGTKVILAVASGQRESTESWLGVLRDLKQRGLKTPRLLVADGHLGIGSALPQLFVGVQEQRCWNHRLLNVKDKLPKRLQPQGLKLLKRIPAALSLKQAEQRKKEFQDWCAKQGQAAAGELLDRDWERMTTFLRFPKEHWKHLRTTNVIESPFARVRLRTDAAKRYKRAPSATAVIWKTLLIAESRFRKLNAPKLLKEVYAGAAYRDGKRVTNPQESANTRLHTV
jgi:putative transposase